MRDAMEQWGRDFRHAARSLRRTPGFAAVTIVTLGLAIGANAAIFSVVDAVLIRPLPYAHADRLVLLAATAPDTEMAPEFGLFDEGYVQYRERSRRAWRTACRSGRTCGRAPRDRPRAACW